ncbi:serine/threonine-protein kinase Nek5-like [Thalassophryne amazonica]|uniref:serine/threonine-protein kinase Nek5-like n=1 Tax=Thalassophryne amazonica TaxID=390379 RepID=UPI001471DBB3|nr:serine/threonine-protein kinase Nek5-like [Thalassophryne amazonica]
MIQKEFCCCVRHRNDAAASPTCKTGSYPGPATQGQEKKEKCRTAGGQGDMEKNPPTKPEWRVPFKVCNPKVFHQRPGPRVHPAGREAVEQQNQGSNIQDPVSCYQHHHGHLDAFQRKNNNRGLPHPVQEEDKERYEVPSVFQPYQLVAAARNEYLQRCQEANQYKLRAEKQLGLRPCTAECYRKHGGQGQEAGRYEHQNTPQDKKQAGQQEYLRQLELIREQYQQDMKELRLRAETEALPQNKHGTFVVEKPREPEPAVVSKEQQNTSLAQDIEAALSQIRQDRKQLQRKHKDKKGIMFEIRLDDEEVKEDTEEQKDGQGVEEKMNDGREEEEEDVDLLNQTLSFQAGEELQVRDWTEMRRAWSRRTPQTLLDALAHMTFASVCSSVAEAEHGMEAAGRLQWDDGPPVTLLNALAQAELTSSTLGSITAELKAKKDDSEEEDSDMEMNEERLEPRSDDDDTNFEESEDELREAVADSMRNLLFLDTNLSSNGAESSTANAAVDDGIKETENGGAVSSVDQQIQLEDSTESEGPGRQNDA